VAERPVRCLTAAVQVLVHDGYELTDKDYRELRLLHERFGVELPPAVRERALATGDHGKLYPSGMPRSSQYRARGRRNALDVNLHDELIARLQYFDGHSDTIGLFADAAFLARAAAAVAEPFAEAGVQKVAGIEARGFVLATAVALELGAGFVAVRKPGAIHPGPKAELTAPPDWRGIETVLRVQRHAIATGDGVLLVDDWAETGSKALTARRLIDACGGRYLGLSLLVDQLPSKLRDELAPVAAVALAEELRE
jgi:adenine phosphoribosyltransferase